MHYILLFLQLPSCRCYFSQYFKITSRHIWLCFFDICSLVPSDQSPYSDVSPLRAPLLNGPPQDCRAMYNPMTPGMTHGSVPGQGIGHCMDQYMRPPQAPPPLSMMGHRGMPPTEGESEYLLHLLNLTAATDLFKDTWETETIQISTIRKIGSQQKAGYIAEI